MIFSEKNETGHTLRMNPEVLGTAAPRNRLRFKIRFLGEGEAEGPFGITALLMVMVLAVVIVVVLSGVH
jgi:hypothetical protein